MFICGMNIATICNLCISDMIFLNLDIHVIQRLFNFIVTSTSQTMNFYKYKVLAMHSTKSLVTYEYTYNYFFLLWRYIQRGEGRG